MKHNLQILLAEAIEDNRREKYSVIDEIMRLKKFLYGLGQTQHDEFISDDTNTALFEYLDDLDLLPLEVIRDNYTKQVNELMRERIGVL